MKPFLLLLITFSISLLLFKLFSGEFNYKFSGNIAMCCMLFFTGVAHFTFTKGMVMMMPPVVPYKTGMIYLTGIMEFLLGIGLIIPQSRYVSAIILIAFFVALLPANVEASLKHINIEKADFTGNGLRYLWFRIPLQIVFIVWVWFFGIKN